MTFLVSPLLAGLVTAAALHFMLERSRLPLDRPNERSLHSEPIPRSGGLAVVPVILLAWSLLPDVPGTLIAVTGALLVVSLLDDLRGVPAALRLSCHLGAAATVAFAALGTDHGWPALALAAVAIGWMTNLYNFMDGADGLAGGMALIGFGVYAAGAWLGGDVQLAIACLAVAAAAGAFLLYNFHPARIFLGDSGSIPLGFLAGTVGLAGWVRGLWPIWFPLLVFSPFVVDATLTLTHRLLRAERVWQAHRSHYYQRLVRCGWGHRRTALAEYALMAACGLGALAGIGRTASIQTALLCAAALVYGILMLLIDRAWCRHNRVVAQAPQREG